MKRGYTLIEVLITITIISVLTVLLIPSINRSLSRNNIAGDAQLLTSKIESARLLAGSTQQGDTSGYYGVYLPPNGYDYIQVVFVSTDPSKTCDPTGLITGNTSLFSASCIVDTVRLSQGVQMANPSGLYRLILFKTPSQQVFYGDNTDNATKIAIKNPDTGFASFAQGITLKYNKNAKTATVNINSTNGQVSGVSYN